MDVARDGFDPLDGLGIGLTGPLFDLVADGRRMTPDSMHRVAPGVWELDGTEVRLLEETTGDGSRSLTLTATGVNRVDEVCLFDRVVTPAPREIHNHRWHDSDAMQGSTVVLVRGDEGGVFACYANPFGRAEITGDRVRLTYRPRMDFWGSFRSDPIVVGPFVRDGRVLQRRTIQGRDVVMEKEPGYARRFGPVPSVLDAGEVRAVRNAVRERLPWGSPRARVSHWDWGENLFRRDLATDDGAMESYDRMLQLCAEIGVETTLLAPTTEELDPTTDGPWQRIMFLGMGLEVARGTLRAGHEPPSVLRLLAAAADHGRTPVAYSNPQILWGRDEKWRVRGHDSPYRWTCLAVEAAADHAIATMTDFARRYGLGGFSLDFVFWFACDAEDHGHAPGADSLYAQWRGYQRIVEALASQPDAWVEALIGSQQVLPWGCRDMTHPHPVLGDNQPQWVPAWPDLSRDRSDGNYQRRTAYWMRNFAFVPSYKVPGQVGHQANRLVDAAVERGWDWEGARFNLLSAIATGPSSLSICFLPVWDEAEWRGMRARDGAFFANWIAFAKEHADVLSRMEDLFDEPRPGAVDGTVAVDGSGLGFVFLANPDYTDHVADVPMSEGRLLLELHPEEGRLWDGRVTVEAHEVAVLRIVDATEVARPALLGVAGSVDVNGAVTEAIGKPGTTVAGVALLEDGREEAVTARFAGDGVTPTLGPWVDASGAEVALEHAAGDVVVVTEWVPGGHLPQLLRQLAPPVQPTGDENLQPWSDPGRLRFFPHLLDPLAVTVSMSVDGQNVEVHQAFVGTFERVKDPAFLEHNLLGHYCDLTDKLEATTDLDLPWRIELSVTGLRPGHLSGVHVAHLPRRRTDLMIP